MSVVLLLVLLPFSLGSLALYYFVVRSLQHQLQSEQNRLVTEALAEFTREQETARQAISLVAGLPQSADFLEASVLATPPPEFNRMEEAARGVLQQIFSQNPYYLRLRLIDTQGMERLRYSKIPGETHQPGPIDRDLFQRLLIHESVQLPMEEVRPGTFVSVYARRVMRPGFCGIAALDLNLSVFQRSFSSLLALHHVSTFLFDDRGTLAQAVLEGLAVDELLLTLDLVRESRRILDRPEELGSLRTLHSERGGFLLSVIPVHESIAFVEPLPGQHWFLGILRSQEVLAEHVRTFQYLFAAVLIFSVVAVYHVSRWYSRRITVPLEEVNAATARIARGDFDIRLNVQTGDEVEQLAASVQRMARSLRRYQRELVHSEKMASMGEMASEMAHEIQNRISGLSLWIQFLDSDMKATDPRRIHLEEMKKGLAHLLDLLSSLKGFYRQPVLNRTLVDINSLVNELVASISPQLEEKGVELTLDLAPDLPAAQIDEEKIRSVLLNLLLNAVEALEALPGQGRIHVTSRIERHEDLPFLTLSVRDNGPGVAATERDRIFYPFVTTKPEGSGLGLAVASNIVTAHGGRIWVEDRAATDAAGATFTFTIPLAAGI